MKRDSHVVTLYPLRLAYANTMCKAQGQTLDKAALWFDIENIPPGTAYVALSRVKKLADIYFITPLKPNFFTPVTSSLEQIVTFVT
jgi:ATP-dependent exoDNAse (exonuclease V) alpha subunit